MTKKRQEVITFKVDESLAKAMKGINNRSEFIRSAILSALDNQCPLCKGTGVLNPAQKKHWNTFSQHHSLKECDECQEITIVCSNMDETPEDEC